MGCFKLCYLKKKILKTWILQSKRSIYQKQKGKCIDVTNHIYTQSCTFQFFTASSSIPVAIAATLILLSCSTWFFIMVLRTRQTTVIMEMAPAFPFNWDIIHEKSWKITGGKDCKDIFHWPYSYRILLFLAKALHLGKMLITDLNTVPPVERSLTTAISRISSALVMYYTCNNLSFWKTHLYKLISNWTWNCLITYTKGVVVISLLVYSLRRLVGRISICINCLACLHVLA